MELLTAIKTQQQEQEMIKIGIMDYITKTDILHQEQLSKFQWEIWGVPEYSFLRFSCSYCRFLKCFHFTTPIKKSAGILLKNAPVSGELELASSKKVLELESKLRESEIRVKNDALKIFTEEVDRITAIYSNHFDKLNQMVECLKMESEEKVTQVNNFVYLYVLKKF